MTSLKLNIHSKLEQWQDRRSTSLECKVYRNFNSKYTWQYMNLQQLPFLAYFPYFIETEAMNCPETLCGNTFKKCKIFIKSYKHKITWLLHEICPDFTLMAIH